VRSFSISLRFFHTASVLKIQTKHEYSAQAELKKFKQSLIKKHDKGPADDETLARLTQRVKNEHEYNFEEDGKRLGDELYYGQVVELVHYATNSLLCGTKTKRAERDEAALRLFLTKDASSNCHFRIMPQFKVRFEGQPVHGGDQIVLVHVKTNLSISLSAFSMPSDGRMELVEVNLHGSETGWSIVQYAPYLPSTEHFLKGSEAIRLYHQDKGMFVCVCVCVCNGKSLKTSF
jgi:inositol 1,4,5-triphosphate receptor type 1